MTAPETTDERPDIPAAALPTARLARLNLHDSKDGRAFLAAINTAQAFGAEPVLRFEVEPYEGPVVELHVVAPPPRARRVVVDAERRVLAAAAAWAATTPEPRTDAERALLEAAAAYDPYDDLPF